MFLAHALNCTEQYGEELYNAVSLLGTFRLFEGIIGNQQGKLGTHYEEIIKIEIMRALPAWLRRADVQKVCSHLAFALGLAAHFHLIF